MASQKQTLGTLWDLSLPPIQHSHTKSSRRLYSWCLRLPSLDTSKNRLVLPMCFVCQNAFANLSMVLRSLFSSTTFPGSATNAQTFCSHVCCPLLLMRKKIIRTTRVWCSPTLPGVFQKERLIDYVFAWPKPHPEYYNDWSSSLLLAHLREPGTKKWLNMGDGFCLSSFTKNDVEMQHGALSPLLGTQRS
jgi:hypothetical protein